MNAPIFLLFVIWLLFAFTEVAIHFLACTKGEELPADSPLVDAGNEADDLPFGPAPSDQD
ncbi:hypothetical protein SAMN06269250_6012 [Spirosoma fluviale]|uniref:Uncharacterized protein n=1 Tax=Spirosoma fluviale TaxID=1597977 RepID=A0A286GR68_9BACT|nr:hypothetical protein SAMN06269250_6012 [Spirosoma fluviale]